MGKIVKVSGPLVVATGMQDANMADVVRVGEQHLIGEILTMNGDSAAIQVYEETSGIGPGAEVVTTGAPLSVELGPGLLENIYDGIQRPLEEIMKLSGPTIARGIQVPALNREKKWEFKAVAKAGDKWPAATSSAPSRRPAPPCTKSWFPTGSPVPSTRSRAVPIQSPKWWLR